MLFLLGVNLYILDIYAYDNALQEGGHTSFSGNKPGTAFLCHATSQDSLAAQSSSEAREMGPPVLQDRVKAPQHPPTAQAPTAYPGSSAGCQRCCSCPPAEQGQGHTDKVINKDSGEMGTGGKERQEGEESKKKIK